MVLTSIVVQQRANSDSHLKCNKINETCWSNNRLAN